jgi:hypothetical protein
LESPIIQVGLGRSMLPDKVCETTQFCLRMSKKGDCYANAAMGSVLESQTASFKTRLSAFEAKKVT